MVICKRDSGKYTVRREVREFENEGVPSICIGGLGRENVPVLYTGERVCDVALIKYTLGSGKTQEGLGTWRGGHKGAMGDKGS
jgi:thiamine monophosphate synthase